MSGLLETLAFVAGSAAAVAALRHHAAADAASRKERLAAFDRAQQAYTAPLPVLGRLEDVEHFPVARLRDRYPDAPAYPSPLLTRAWPKNKNFVGAAEEIISVQALGRHPSAPPLRPRAFLAAGPVESLFFEPAAVRAAIVTCGGLCPGLNTVIREIVNALT